jgi:N-acetylmuramic acid 6-phosphate etherase
MALEDHLTTEARNPASEEIDQARAADIVALMNAEDARVVAAVRAEAEAIAWTIERVAEAFRRGGRLVYVGAGTSGRLGVLDAAECPPTFGTAPEVVIGVIAGGPAALTRAVEGSEDDPAAGARAIEELEIDGRDVVVGIATSGRTPYVLGAVRRARERGALAIGLVCNRPSVLASEVDQEIAPIVGPEIISGSTRLKSGTATKMVLNMITTGAMVLIGKTYGHYMVDLRPTNEKLRIRSRRILRELAGVDETEALRLLDATGGELKPALVMAMAGVGHRAAVEALAGQGGQVRDAVRSLAGASRDE